MLLAGFLGHFAAITVAGIVLGGIFALTAVGIVLVYRVTGVLNLAQGAMGMFSTFMAWAVLHYWHPFAKTSNLAFSTPSSIAVAVVVALLFSLLLGLALENLVFRWIRGRPPVVKTVVTVGILLTLQSSAALLFGSTQYHEAIQFFDSSRCPDTNLLCFTIVLGPVRFGYDQLLVVGATLLLATGLALFLRYARVGVAMRAVSDDAVAASLYGIPVNMIGSVSWMLGSLVAAVAGILLISIGVTFDTVSLTVLIVDGLAAALIGGLVSLPLAVVGGFALGLLETYPKLWISQSTGLPKVIAILVILAVLMLRSERSLLRAKT
ncbi:MAG TPA: branched-chain amino acid ABC transporter permease [Candidatus Solibacter sp.]|jgi:branched-chain amino acid transport system permease protein|nr:branched-chain amino acid ABC transporter permease [Candidatus Solibacter sp.]